MNDSTSGFAPRGTAREVELGTRLMPKFGDTGLLTCVTTSAETGEVLMLAHMNAEALARTMQTGIAHYWSRSRRTLWRKGDTSGSVQRVVEARIDCDQDAVLLRVRVEGSGASCHVGYRSCFYRKIPLGAAPSPDARLVFAEEAPLFDPAAVYGKEGDGG